MSELYTLLLKKKTLCIMHKEILDKAIDRTNTTNV